MKRGAALLMLVSGTVLAHPGHGALEGHLHGWGLEHAVLIAAVVGLIIYAFKKK
jgi:hypothetical protein